MAIEIPYNLTDGLVKDITNDVIRDIQTSRDPLAKVVDDYVCGSNYNNDDFDDLVQIVLNCMSIAAEQYDRKGYDIDRDDKCYQDAFNQSIPVGISVFCFRTRRLQDDLNDREYNQCRDIDDGYRDSIERQVDFEGRGRNGRNSRNDRERGRNDRNRDRDYRDNRNDRDYDRGRSSSRRPDRDNRRTNRDEGRPATSERRNTTPRREEPRRNERSDRNERNDRSQREVRVEPIKVTLPLPPNMAVTAAQGREGAGFVINPQKQSIVITPTRGTDGVEGIVMEPYEKHELGMAVVVPKDDGIVVPLVDFTATPEFLDKESVAQTAGLTVVKEPQVVEDVMFNLNYLVSQVRAYQRSKVPNNADLLVPANNVATFKLPAAMFDTFSSLPDVNTFALYHRLLSTIRDYLTNSNGEVGRQELSGMYLALSTHIRTLLNEFLRINFGDYSIDGEFVDDWNDVKNFVDETPDVRTLFYAEEVRFLETNAGYEQTAKEEDGSFSIRITAKYLVMAYNKYFLGNTILPSRRGHYCRVDAANTIEYYNACAKLMRLRNTHYPNCPVVMLDSNNVPVRLVSSRMEGANIFVWVS